MNERRNPPASGLAEEAPTWIELLEAVVDASRLIHLHPAWRGNWFAPPPGKPVRPSEMAAAIRAEYRDTRSDGDPSVKEYAPDRAA